MSGNNSQAANPSRWGNFFQQAVAGVESRLDHMLGEDELAAMNNQAGKSQKPADQQPAPQSGMTMPQPQSNARSRSSSTAPPPNDRLQERLARAVVKPGDAPVPSTRSRTTSPLPSNAKNPATQSETTQTTDGHRTDTTNDNISTTASTARSSNDGGLGASETSQQASHDAEETAEVTTPLSEDSGPQKDQPSTSQVIESRGGIVNPDIGATAPTDGPATDYDTAMAQLQADHEAAEQRWQEELHTYTEKIDALQAKLKYLAKEAADSAKKAAVSADSGSLEKKIHEKDEQIANLMEEGQKLSKMELDHRATIKRLRQYTAENTKLLADSKRKTESVEKNLAKAEERAKRAELAERRAVAKVNEHSKLEKHLGSVTAERDGFAASITDLKSQLAAAVSRAEAAEQKTKTESQESESRQIASLKDDLSSAKIERELSEEKLRREISDLNEGISREKERARLLEVELRGEQSVLESKLESLRARAEEVSSSATGDAQAKLLRQIETLQSQYAVASENWQGIESSLLSRLTNVEKERDDIARKEGDLRRKAREANLKTRKAEGELESLREVNQELKRNIEESKHEVEKLSAKLTRTDNELAATKQELVVQKETLNATWTQRMEDEKAKWQEQSSNSASRFLQTRAESPVTLNGRSEPLATPSQRAPVLSVPFSGVDTPPRQNSASSLSSNRALRGANNAPAQSTDVQSTTFEPEEYFNGTVTPATPSANSQPARGINDIISVSTVGAGPSVQLVERMSATVRRLESEKTALKDELSRLTTQRDEARQEVVNLMAEVEEKRAGDKRINELEESIGQLDQRYQTTLEMLGEKSEQVEEQKADIEDLKKIYRELVESMVK